MRWVLAAGMLLAACRDENPRANARAQPIASADASAPTNANTQAFVAVRDGTVVRTKNGERIQEAASIAKLVVAVAVMQLVERGAIELDGPIASYVSFVPRPITMRQLLTHTSGIVDGNLPERRADALDPFLRAHLAKASAWGEAGHRYSNVGFALAASVVEHVSGVSFADYTESKIFGAIGMTRTSWTAPPGMALPRRWTDGRFVELPVPSHVVYPAVDLFSTADDLALFAIAILDNRLLKADTTRRMLDEGLGWQSRTIGAHAVVGHEGEDIGASTAFFLDRKAKTAAIVLANDDTFQSNDPLRLAAFESLLESLL